MKTALRRVARAFARRVVFPAVEGLWAAGFALAGAALRPGLHELSPEGDARVLVVAPHADDETLACGMAIAGHVEAGDEVTVAVVTDGRRSRAGGVGPEAMRLQRQGEARRAIEELGARAVLLDLPEGEWRRAECAPVIRESMARARPDIVYAPSTIDFHPEHKRVARCLAANLGAVEIAGIEVRVYELQVPLTPTLANACIIGYPAARRHKHRALAYYTSQRSSFGWLARHERYNALVYRTRSVPEVFARMSPEAYIALVSAATPARFRSMRPRPLTDPLSWLVGLGARLKAARAAGVRPLRRAPLRRPREDVNRPPIGDPHG